SSTFTTGVCHRMILEEWPAIKADIDGRRLSPIGLVRGSETPLDFAATFRDLSKCHQVLAWGYDVSGTSVTLRIYDPNFLADDRTIAFDTGDPERASVTVTGYDGDPFRAFFRESYAYHDPRTPLEYKLAGANVVSSPGIAR
ncbi:MAG TPA: hypothetical protein VKT78_19315, partial [Fimbriimonadaceae bacterium]|nr:hypothetical protein [Fimbriimonadaceae bacterium]